MAERVESGFACWRSVADVIANYNPHGRGLRSGWLGGQPSRRGDRWYWHWIRSSSVVSRRFLP